MAPTLPNGLISASVCSWRMEGSSLHQDSLVNSYRSSIDGSPWRSIFRRLGGRLLSSERCIILHAVRVFRDPATKMPHARRIVSVAWCGCSGMIAAIGGVGLVDQAAAAGSPTISSSRKGASVSSAMDLARRTANSSFHSNGMAPMSRTMASNYGIA